MDNYEDVLITPADSIDRSDRERDANAVPDLELTVPVPRRKLLDIEPAVFALFFGVNLSTSIFVNNLVYQICIFDLKQDASVCKYLGTANETDFIQDLETEAQKYSADITMVLSIFTNVVPAILSLFLGPWSDRFGRKPIMISSTVAFFLQHVITAFICALSNKYNLNPWLYTLAYVPILFTGGYCSLITVLFSYITDVTEGKDRAVKMMALEAALYLGLFLGSLSSSSVLNYLNTTQVFGTSALLILLSCIYIVLFIKESILIPSTFSGSKFRELFRIHHLNEMVEASTRRRPDWCRLIVWLICLSSFLTMFVMEGAYTVNFLFVREKFGWTIHDYALFDSMSIFTQVLGTVIGLFLFKKIFKISDPMLAVIGISSYVLDSITRGVATVPVHMYLAIGLSIFRSMYGPMVRSVISTIVPNDEIGKVFALLTSLESISPLVGAPLFSKLYKHTIETMPSAFNFLSAGIYMLCDFFILTAYVLLQGLPQVTYISISN